MSKTITCILCPHSCEIKGQRNGDDITITGNRCVKGKGYALQEFTNPLRTIATSVLVRGGELPLCSVRLTKPIPKAKIFAVMDEIKKQRLDAPVQSGQMIIHDVLGLGSDVIATKCVAVKK